MKGKTGSNKMRGGGIATKGTGAALKGGGLARKGVGAALKGGGKVKKMADGGATDKVKSLTDQVLARRKRDINKAVPTSIVERAMFRRESGDPDNMSLRKSMLDASMKRKNRDLSLLNTYGADAMKARSFMSEDRPEAKKMADGGMNRPVPTTPAVNPAGRTLPAQARAYGLRDRTDGPGKGMMTRPGFPSRGPAGAALAQPGLPSSLPVGSAMGAIGQLPFTQSGALATMGRKNGGKVAKYAKGGAVKMTAGAGSGLGRLEKVAAHKAAPRVKAENLKNGGKVKGKK